MSKPFDSKLNGTLVMAPFFSANCFIAIHFLLWAGPRDDADRGQLFHGLDCIVVVYYGNSSEASSHSSSDTSDTSSEIKIIIME